MEIADRLTPDSAASEECEIPKAIRFTFRTWAKLWEKTWASSNFNPASFS